MRTSTVETWLGPFTAVVDDDGAVLAAGWTPDVTALVPLIHPSLLGAAEPVRRQDLGDVTKAVAAYHDGDIAAVDTVPLVARAAVAARMASYFSASSTRCTRNGHVATRPRTSSATVPAVTTATARPGTSAFRR